MASKKANCGNCKNARPAFASERLECHRHAPAPYNALVFYISELLRDCAWSLRSAHNIEEPWEHDDLRSEATEAPDHAVWPTIERDDWCAEWRGK
jgi:hypothetical protein